MGEIPFQSNIPEVEIQPSRTPEGIYFAGKCVAAFANREYANLRVKGYTKEYFQMQPIFEPYGKNKLTNELRSLTQVLLDEIPSNSGIDFNNLAQAARTYSQETIDDNSTSYVALKVIEDYLQKHATPEDEKHMQGLWSKRWAYNIKGERKLQFDVMRTGITFLREDLEAKLTPQEREKAYRALQ